VNNLFSHKRLLDSGRSHHTDHCKWSSFIHSFIRWLSSNTTKEFL